MYSKTQKRNLLIVDHIYTLPQFIFEKPSSYYLFMIILELEYIFEEIIAQ